MLTFFAGVVAGISAVGLLVIVLAPSRRIREEARLDREVETRLLLGVDPDVDPDDDHESESSEPDHDHSDFGAAELQALRQLGSERAASSRRRGSKARRQ